MRNSLRHLMNTIAWKIDHLIAYGFQTITVQGSMDDADYVGRPKRFRTDDPQERLISIRHYDLSS